MKWKATKLTNMTTEIRVDMDGRKDQFKALLASDVHLDHPYCQTRKWFKCVEEAVACNAPIILNGDFLCLMQTTKDPRQQKGKTRPEHDHQDYFREIAIDTVNRHGPQAMKQFAYLGYGNHETSPLKHYSVDPVKMLADQSQRLTGHRPIVGGYRGWIMFRFRRCGQAAGAGVRLYHHHGFGGGGPVTKGAILTNRMNAYVDGADGCWIGHIHEKWLMYTPQTYVTTKGTEKIRERWHLCTPGFKEEFADREQGFHIEKGRPPKPIGAAWLHLWYEGDEIKSEVRFTR